MVNWQITATTVRCDAVDDEVTLLVYKDWTVKCTGYNKYKRDANNEGRGIKASPRRGTGCAGTQCPLAVQYRQKLQAEQTRPHA